MRGLKGLGLEWEMTKRRVSRTPRLLFLQTFSNCVENVYWLVVLAVLLFQYGCVELIWNVCCERRTGFSKCLRERERERESNYGQFVEREETRERKAVSVSEGESHEMAALNTVK